MRSVVTFPVSKSLYDMAVAGEGSPERQKEMNIWMDKKWLPELRAKCDEFDACLKAQLEVPHAQLHALSQEYVDASAALVALKNFYDRKIAQRAHSIYVLPGAYHNKRFALVNNCEKTLQSLQSYLEKTAAPTEMSVPTSGESPLSSGSPFVSSDNRSVGPSESQSDSEVSSTQGLSI